MKIPTKRFDESLPLPKYEKQAAGFDFICRAGATLKPSEITAIPANLALAIPEGYVLLIVPRSSTPSSFGLMMPHSVGVLDPYYSGDKNEIVLLLQNFTKKAVRVKKGDILAQGILIKYERVEFDEKKKLKSSTRGKWKVPCIRSK
ncbi:MAG: dUTP diphosphatase [bacterium]|nr:dUTP diphosphatase [bacterium]